MLQQSAHVKPHWRKLEPFGAEILDLNLASASRDDIDMVVDTFSKNGALVIRNQSMTPEQLIEFVSHFGAPQVNTSPFTLDERKYITVMSNRRENGKPIGAHNDGIGWHTDLSFKERPALCTLLYAVEVPPEGSDTLLADGCAAYEALPADRKEELARVQVLNSFIHFVETREHNRRKTTPEEALMFPDVLHPLVRTHPVNGRKALWPTSGTTKDVLGLPEGEDGFRLLDDIIDYMTQECFVYRHKWQVGDILLWDNRCSLHTGTPFDDTKYFRTMYRLWVEGDRPV